MSRTQACAVIMKRKQPVDSEDERRTTPRLDTKQVTTFLNLPRELRLQVYNAAIFQAPSGNDSGCNNIYEWAGQVVSSMKTLHSLKTLSSSLRVPALADEIDLTVQRAIAALNRDVLDFEQLVEECEECEDVQSMPGIGQRGNRYGPKDSYRGLIRVRKRP